MKFIEIYKKLAVSDAVTPEQLYQNAIELLNRELDKQAGQNNAEPSTLVSSFKEAQEKQSHKIDVANIFKE